MRRTLLCGSSLVLGLSLFCCAEETPPPAAPPPVAAAPLPPPPPPPHAAAPAVPPGVELASLDPSVSPCDDFFQYACGGWVKAHPIPDDEGRWGRFNALAEQNETALRAILDKDAATPAAPPKAAKGPVVKTYDKALGDFYASCMDEAGVEKDGIAALKPLLREIDGVTDPKSLARVVADMQLAGVDPFFMVDSEQDAKDATTMIAGLDQAGLGMPDRDYYLKDDPETVKVRDAYLEHIANDFVLLGDKPDLAKTEAANVLAFEKTLAAAQISRVDHRNPDNVYHPMDPKGVATTAPAFAWDVYWNELGLAKVAKINVAVPAFLTAQFTAAPDKAAYASTLRPYMRFHLVSGYSRMLPKAFVDESFAFEKKLTGAAKILPRWKRCVRAVDHGMGEALAIPFVADKLGAEGKATTQTMVQQIETAMQTDLGALAWMDSPTRERALEKVHKLFNKIGYPDEWRSYDTLAPKIRRSSYVSNVLESHRFESHRKLTQVGKPVDRKEWDMTPPTVNAYYNAQLNEMVFPAGILQSPFYAKEAPAAVNFGGLGMVMGHELTHGFDDEGRKFDADGNLKDWWSAPVGADFDKRASCVANQFDGYTAIDDVHVNGKLTLGENLADLGGAKLALSVLHSVAPASDEGDRQFFFGISQVWCGALRPEMQRVRVRTDPHSPARFRVDGPLSNMPEFAHAFACRAGDPMVRPDDKRCSVW
jgi:putative endopeptidase